MSTKESLLLLGDKRGEIAKLHKQKAWKSIIQYLKIYTAIFVMIFLATKFSNPLLTIFAMIFIAGRQHSLYILNHDASHYSLFKSRSTNKVVATLFSNLVMFHHPEAWSYVQWRRIHLQHHRHLFTKGDPNYVGRENAGDTQRIYTGKQLVAACLLAVPQTFKQFFNGYQDYVPAKSFKFYSASCNHLKALISPFKQDPEMEVERRLKLIFFLVALIAILYFNLGTIFFLYWVLPMYLFYPIILRFHDLTEHRWASDSDDININTRSVKIGILTKVFFSFLPRGFHREHHLFPKVNVTNLPKLNKLLHREQVVEASILGVAGIIKDLTAIIENY